jgi:hypothetical protein
VLFLKHPFSVSVRGVNSHCIDVIMSSDETNSWRATFVYGESKCELQYILRPPQKIEGAMERGLYFFVGISTISMS